MRWISPVFWHFAEPLDAARREGDSRVETSCDELTDDCLSLINQGIDETVLFVHQTVDARRLAVEEVHDHALLLNGRYWHLEVLQSAGGELVDGRRHESTSLKSEKLRVEDVVEKVVEFTSKDGGKRSEGVAHRKAVYLGGFAHKCPTPIPPADENVFASDD